MRLRRVHRPPGPAMILSRGMYCQAVRAHKHSFLQYGCMLFKRVESWKSHEGEVCCSGPAAWRSNPAEADSLTGGGEGGSRFPRAFYVQQSSTICRGRVQESAGASILEPNHVDMASSPGLSASASATVTFAERYPYFLMAHPGPYPAPPYPRVTCPVAKKVFYCLTIS